jgi:tetraacyldisaccharide 4'-kinase
VAAAQALLRDAPDVDVILSDDGLQHYRLARAFEIAVVDGARGLGNRLCLPAGPLREPPARLETVDAIVVNEGVGGGPSGASAGAASRGALPREVETSGALRVSMSLAVTRVYRLADGVETRLDAFRGQTVHAVAGIGHPERFFEMLEGAGLTVLRHPLPDHARVLPEDLPREPAAPVLTTEKDGVKLRGAARNDIWCVAVEADVAGAEAARLLAAIESAMEAHLARAAQSKRRP